MNYLDSFSRRRCAGTVMKNTVITVSWHTGMMRSIDAHSMMDDEI